MTTPQKGVDFSFFPDIGAMTSVDASAQGSTSSSPTTVPTTVPDWSQVLPSEWDAWDLICYLGIQQFQPERVRQMAPTVSRTDAHARSASGQYTDPALHAIRSQCKFPYLIDREPKFHQLWAVAHYFSLAYSADRKLRDVCQFVIADDTGLGKTTEIAMIIAYQKTIPEDTGRTTPVFWPFRYRRSAQPSVFKPVLVVTRTNVHRQLWGELESILDNEQFCVDKLPRPVADARERRAVYRPHTKYLSNPSSNETPIVVTTWDILCSEYKIVFPRGTFKEEFTDQSLFQRNNVVKWAMIFFDEGQDSRNPQTDRFTYTQRLSKNALATFSVTATPVFNSPLDLVNVLRSIGYDVSAGPQYRRPTTKHERRLNKKTREKLQGIYNGCNKFHMAIILDYAILERARWCSQRAIKKLRAEGNLDGPVITLGPGWEHTALPDSDEARDVRSTWLVREEDVMKGVMRPLYQSTRRRMIRRRRDTPNMFYDSLNCDKAVSIADVWVDLPAHERTKYNEVRNHEGVKDPQLPDGYATKARQTLIITAQDRDVDPATVEDDDVEDEDMHPVPAVTLPDSPNVDLAHALPSVKVQAAIEVAAAVLREDKELPDEERRKVLIYMHWVEIVPQLQRQFEDAGCPAAAVNGKTSEKHRKAIFEAFQGDEDHEAYSFSGAVEKGKKASTKPSRILIISSASNSGIDLHRANVLILLDQPWTQAERDQVIGRVHRFGQTRDVTVKAILVRDSVDSWLVSTAQRKGRCATVIDEQARHIAPLLSGIPAAELPAANRASLPHPPRHGSPSPTSSPTAGPIPRPVSTKTSGRHSTPLFSRASSSSSVGSHSPSPSSDSESYDEIVTIPSKRKMLATANISQKKKRVASSL